MTTQSIGRTMLKLIEFGVCKETVSMLRGLLRQALDGGLRGIAVCCWKSDGSSEVLLTGVYRAQPVHALRAADLIKATADHQLDLFT